MSSSSQRKNVSSASLHILFVILCALTALKTHAQPTNDLFENRIEVAGTNILLTSSLVAASEQPGEPIPLYGCGYTGGSVWWTWTAPASGSVLIDASAWEGCVRIAVFTGVSLTNLTSVPLLQPFDGQDCRARFETQQGTQFQIMVDSADEYDPLIASLVFTPTPANDDFTNRIVLSGDCITITNEIVGATLQPNEPPHKDWWFGPRSVWFEWTAVETGTVRITPLSLFPIPVIDAYTGDSFESLQPIDTGTLNTSKSKRALSTISHSETTLLSSPNPWLYRLRFFRPCQSLRYKLASKAI